MRIFEDEKKRLCEIADAIKLSVELDSIEFIEEAIYQIDKMLANCKKRRR